MILLTFCASPFALYMARPFTIYHSRFTISAPFLGVFVLYRFGLLAAMSAFVVYHLLVFYPMTTGLSAWYARDFLACAGLTIALVGYSFYVSLGEQ